MACSQPEQACIYKYCCGNPITVFYNHRASNTHTHTHTLTHIHAGADRLMKMTVFVGTE